METYNKNITEYQNKYVNENYQKHRKFVKEFFDIDLPNKLN